jgi:PAS domain S-box-containing protein
MASGSLTAALRETLALFDGSGTPRTTSEVAARLGVGRRSAYDRLARLVECDRLATKKVGANARVWWRPSDADPVASGTGRGRGGEAGPRPTLSERRQFELLVDAVEEYAIFVLDAEGRVRTWNAGARTIKGYEREEILGEHVSTFYADEDVEAGVPERNLDAAVREGHVEDEGWRVRADGSRFWATVTITAVRDDGGELVGYTKVTRDMTDRRERERQLRRERDLVDRIFEMSPVGIGVLSRGGLERVNSRGAELYGIERGDADEYAVGDPAVYDAEGRPVPPEERPNARVFETGRPVDEWECQLEGRDGVRRWLSVSAAPITDRDGAVERVVVATKDITRLKDRTRRIERQRNSLRSELDEIFERIDDGFFALDDEWRFTHLNDEAERLLDRSREELLGEDVWEEFPDAAESTFRREYERAMGTQEAVTFEEFYPPLDAWFEAHAYPSETGLSVYFRDVTERKERELALERYETIFETVGDAIYVVDEGQRFVEVNRTAEDLSGFDRERILGATVADFIGEEAADHAFELAEDLSPEDREVAAAEYTLTAADGTEVPVDVRFTRLPTADGRDERVGVARDVTDRVERERELERYEAVFEAINDGIFVVDPEGRFTTVNGTYAAMTGYARDELVGASTSLVVDEGVRETAREIERSMRRGETRTGTVEATMVRADGERFPAEATFALLSHDDGGYERIGVVRDVTDRKRREEELRRHREQLAALNDLNDLVQEISVLSIRQSTREEIEELLCDRLADADSYEFAWIGEFDASRGDVTVRERAEGGARSDDRPTDLPAGADDLVEEAFRTSDVRVARDLPGDSDDPRRDGDARDRGYRSAAAIPLTYEHTLYGVLIVYSARPDAFADAERTVFERLGTTIGHAIRSVEQRRALMAEEVVQLDLHLKDILSLIDAEVGWTGRVDIDRTIPTRDGSYVQYVTSTPDAVDALYALVTRSEVITDVVGLGEVDGNPRFEIHYADPPITETIVSNNGRVVSASMRDGGLILRAEFPPQTDVGALVSQLRQEYPQIEMLAQRSSVLIDDHRGTDTNAVLSRLTERQRASAEAAYFAGYFDWPRKTTGEELAETMGVSAPTLHQHLRNAQRRVFDSLLSGGEPN